MPLERAWISEGGELRGRRGQKGFALIAAVALLVVVGSTSAIMIRMSAVQQAGSTASILGVRGDWAARSGIEWALHRAMTLGDCPAAATTINLNEGALSGFRVVVRCTSSSHFEGSLEHKSLQIRSEATFGTIGTRDFVYREMQASAVL